MGEVVYVSEVTLERVKGPVRRARLPANPDDVIFGVHGGVAEWYGVEPSSVEPRTTTLDYVTAAAGG